MGGKLPSELRSTALATAVAFVLAAPNGDRVWPQVRFSNEKKFFTR